MKNNTMKLLKKSLGLFVFLFAALSLQGQFDCIVDQGVGGCAANADCEDEICGADPFCCSVNWDSICGDAANGNSECLSAGPPPPTNPCDVSSNDPGTVDVDCANDVCGIDSFCCSVSWDGACVALALSSPECCDCVTVPDPAICASASGVLKAGVCSAVASNDLCDDATPIACGDTLSGDTSDDTLDTVPGAFCGTSVTAPGEWFVLTAPDSGSAIFSTCNQAAYDTKISVFDGSCAALNCVGGLDDSAGCNLTTELTVPITAGTDYFVLVHGFGTATGTFDLSVTCTTCSDGIQNGDEEGVDCGGLSCPPCETCVDGIQNQDETGIDCGGATCPPCFLGCADGEAHFQLNILTDNFGGETGWELSGPGGLIAEVDNVSDGGLGLPNASVIQENVCIPCNDDPNAYTFTLQDSFGDGICCGFGIGSYSISEDGNPIPTATTGEFLTEEITTFGTTCIACPAANVPVIIGLLITQYCSDPTNIEYLQWKAGIDILNPSDVVYSMTTPVDGNAPGTPGGADLLEPTGLHPMTPGTECAPVTQAVGAYYHCADANSYHFISSAVLIIYPPVATITVAAVGGPTACSGEGEVVTVQIMSGIAACGAPILFDVSPNETCDVITETISGTVLGSEIAMAVFAALQDCYVDIDYSIDIDVAPAQAAVVVTAPTFACSGDVGVASIQIVSVDGTDCGAAIYVTDATTNELCFATPQSYSGAVTDADFAAAYGGDITCYAAEPYNEGPWFVSPAQGTLEAIVTADACSEEADVLVVNILSADGTFCSEFTREDAPANETCDVVVETYAGTVTAADFAAAYTNSDASCYVDDTYSEDVNVAPEQQSAAFVSDYAWCSEEADALIVNIVDANGNICAEYARYDAPANETCDIENVTIASGAITDADYAAAYGGDVSCYGTTGFVSTGSVSPAQQALAIVNVGDACSGDTDVLVVSIVDGNGTVCSEVAREDASTNDSCDSITDNFTADVTAADFAAAYGGLLECYTDDSYNEDVNVFPSQPTLTGDENVFVCGEMASALVISLVAADGTVCAPPMVDEDALLNNGCGIVTDRYNSSVTANDIATAFGADAGCYTDLPYDVRVRTWPNAMSEIFSGDKSCGVLTATLISADGDPCACMVEECGDGLGTDTITPDWTTIAPYGNNQWTNNTPAGCELPSGSPDLACDCACKLNIKEVVVGGCDSQTGLYSLYVYMSHENEPVGEDIEVLLNGAVVATVTPNIAMGATVVEIAGLTADAVAGNTVDANFVTTTACAATQDTYDAPEPCLLGSIGNHVYDDLNNNGVQDAGEPGLAGVTVDLTLPDASTDSAVTDSYGYYSFDGLTQIGDYVVDVDETTVPAGYVLTSANDPHPVTLAGGEDYGDADFGFIDSSCDAYQGTVTEP